MSAIKFWKLIIAVAVFNNDLVILSNDTHVLAYLNFIDFTIQIALHYLRYSFKLFH